jgi:hypothetical protein
MLKHALFIRLRPGEVLWDVHVFAFAVQPVLDGLRAVIEDMSPDTSALYDPRGMDIFA